MKTTVKPALLAGFQDVLPSQMIPFQKMVGRIRGVFESFGFVPLETPGMERREVLTGGSDDFNKSIFATRIITGAEDRGTTLEEDDAAMRFDLTVPLARVVASYPDLPRPFKRYQFGKVWRGEKPQKNRYREFFQFDADIIGANSILADTEIIQLMYETLRAFELDDFLIRISDRRILDGLAEAVGCIERPKDFNRFMDKADTFRSTDKFVAELTRAPSNKAFDPKLVLTSEQGEKVREFLLLAEDTPDELLRRTETFFGELSAQAGLGIRALWALVENLTTLGIPRKFWKIDLAVARGLDYYSGPVFETSISSMPEVGSVFSGGRFDGLTSRFIEGSKIPGVGASVGVDRLFTVLTTKGTIKAQAGTARVLVTRFRDDKLAQVSLAVANRIRARGIPTELYLGEEEKVGPQIIYAVKQGARYAVIIGSDEVAENMITLKDLSARTQETLTEAVAIDRILAGLR